MLAPTFNCWTVPESWSSFGAIPISWLKSFLSSRVIRPLSLPRGQRCGAPPAQGAPVGQFGKPCNRRPVQLDVFSGQPGEELSPFLDVLLDEPSKDFSPVGGPVDLLLSAGDIDRAGIVARLAPDAAFQRLDQGLPEGPVVILGEKLFETVEELLDQLAPLPPCSWASEESGPKHRPGPTRNSSSDSRIEVA